jgi:hypothetical protein
VLLITYLTNYRRSCSHITARAWPGPRSLRSSFDEKCATDRTNHRTAVQPIFHQSFLLLEHTKASNWFFIFAAIAIRSERAHRRYGRIQNTQLLCSSPGHRVITSNQWVVSSVRPPFSKTSNHPPSLLRCSLVLSDASFAHCAVLQVTTSEA